MSWRSHGKNNQELVDKLEENVLITSQEVKYAMLRVDRQNYCPTSPYKDRPQGIRYNVTISAPHMNAHALELLKDHLRPGMKALDIGSGSGYLTVCMALMVGDNGMVVGVDHIQELVDWSRQNMKKDGKEDMLNKRSIMLVVGDGRKGFIEEAPFDAIHVGAAADGIPKDLIDQLNFGGRMAAPVGSPGGEQYMEQFDKDEHGQVSRKRLFGVRYVPLTDKRIQYKS